MSLLKKLLGIGEPVRRVSMIASVGELEAGRVYDIPVTLADMYIARGYANGQLSRDYADHELAALRANSQTVVI